MAVFQFSLMDIIEDKKVNIVQSKIHYQNLDVHNSSKPLFMGGSAFQKIEFGSMILIIKGYTQNEG